jgi:hypothetical protein
LIDFLQEGALEQARRVDPQFMKPTIEGTFVSWRWTSFSADELEADPPDGTPASGEDAVG